MAIKTNYVCQQCGFCASKWHGRCPECDAWNSLLEEQSSPRTLSKKLQTTKHSALRLTDIADSREQRIHMRFTELERVLGHGLTRGSVVLLAGDPGIGKSTLLFQLLGELATSTSKPLLYISGEESQMQLKMRAQRLGIVSDHIHIMTETNLIPVLASMEQLQPEVVVLDSVQTLYWPELSSIPGSVSQVKEVADRVIRLAKKQHMATFLIGHITKDGSIAGPKMLEHLVDTVLQFEGDKGHSYRMIRSLKNRFGPTHEIAVFEMGEKGLSEVDNPSKIFLEGRPTRCPGSVVYPAMEGTRPILLEVQGLATRTHFGLPVRNAVGFDKNRLSMLLAILDKRLGFEFGSQDVYVNIVGGISLDDPAADLAILAALLSSYLGKSFAFDGVAFGEVGLAGEVRVVSHPTIRMMEADKLGFKSCIGPSLPKITPPSKLNYHAIASVKELVDSFEIM